jgi:hypothetical protein
MASMLKHIWESNMTTPFQAPERVQPAPVPKSTKKKTRR